MAKFIVRRFLLLLLTMVIVSVAVFLITESSPGNVARNVLGAFVTKEQEKSFLAQMGLDKPVYLRYLYWLFGSDWHASKKVGMPLKRIVTKKGFEEWWALRKDGSLIRWKLSGEDLVARSKTRMALKTSTWTTNGGEGTRRAEAFSGVWILKTMR